MNVNLITHPRYNDNYLVIDEDMADSEDTQNFHVAGKKSKLKRILCIIAIVIASLAIIAFIAVFVGFPLAFKYNVSIQENLVFTRWGLTTDSIVFQNYRFAAYKNHYVEVVDAHTNSTINLGVWHILPYDLAKIAVNNENYNFNEALMDSNISVILYFHGTGEDRTQSWQKYQMMRLNYHLISFDYRGYGDSDSGLMREDNIVEDCLQLYQWLRSHTNSEIIIWGHSLGSSLAARVAAQVHPHALILESTFTSFEAELYHHPYTKYFTWLPWFRATVVNPLRANRFIFNTTQSVIETKSPILFLHAMDDEIIPSFMSAELYEQSELRNVEQAVKNATTLRLYPSMMRLNHYFIYRDSFTVFYILDFINQLTS